MQIVFLLFQDSLNTKNVVKKLVPDPFLKYQNWVYLQINNLNFYTVCFFVCPSRGLPKYVKTKVLNVCLYLFIKLFWKKIRSWTSLWNELVAEMLQKQNFIWYETIFSFNQNKFVFNKIYFHYMNFFFMISK